MWRNVRANQTELKRRRGSVRFDRPSAERQSRWLGRTEPSPSTAHSSPSKPSRAHDLPSRAQAEGLLGLLGLIPGWAVLSTALYCSSVLNLALAPYMV